MKLEAGTTYKLCHARKGNAVVKVLQIGEPWIDVQIVSGHLQGIGDGSYRGPGDEVRVRDSLSTFTLAEDGG